MSMNCLFCNKSVVGHTPITVPGEGFAHLHCFQSHQALKRTFQTLDISQLSDSELGDLKEMIIAEENARARAAGDDGDVELF
jgi:hypothetical protein